MAEPVSIYERYEYQDNATKKIENQIYVIRGNSKFAILFEQTTYIRVHYQSIYEIYKKCKFGVILKLYIVINTFFSYSLMLLYFEQYLFKLIVGY